VLEIVLLPFGKRARRLGQTTQRDAAGLRGRRSPCRNEVVRDALVLCFAQAGQARDGQTAIGADGSLDFVSRCAALPRRVDDVAQRADQFGAAGARELPGVRAAHRCGGSRRLADAACGIVSSARSASSDQLGNAHSHLLVRRFRLLDVVGLPSAASFLANVVAPFVQACSDVLRDSKRRAPTCAHRLFQVILAFDSRNSFMRTKWIAGERRAALTLIELVVVMVILAALAAMVIPRFNGVTSQANTSSNASTVGDVNRAVGLYEARFGVQPKAWDSLLNSSGSFFSKLNPAVTTTANNWNQQILQVATLDANQCASLRAAGITGFHDADEARVCPPSDNSTVFRSISASGSVTAATLVKTPLVNGHGSTFIDKALGIDDKKTVTWANEFVVFGMGGPTSVKGATMEEIPLIQSAFPAKYYARVMCVYMVPPTGSTTPFTAQYVGCFLPDGTSLRDNIDSYNSSNVTSN
jgi:type II secretory pathway pseudopilin PulG